MQTPDCLSACPGGHTSIYISQTSYLQETQQTHPRSSKGRAAHRYTTDVEILLRNHGMTELGILDMTLKEHLARRKKLCP
jgi:hypothetical protein